jgi:uncharacterized protein (DUF1778 family)
MATKKKTPKETAGTVTVGTRLEPKQKELVDEAARLSDCTPAKFIRDAALQRAVAVVNSSGPSEIRLRQLAGMLVKHIYAIEAYAVRDDEDFILGCVVQSPLYGKKTPDGPQDAPIFVYEVIQELAGEIKEATRTCGSEFARFFKEAMFAENRGRVTYKPELNPDDYL